MGKRLAAVFTAEAGIRPLFDHCKTLSGDSLPHRFPIDLSLKADFALDQVDLHLSGTQILQDLAGDGYTMLAFHAANPYRCPGCSS